MAGLMTVKEVAEYLKVNKRTIYRLLRRGAIPAAQIGHQWRFDRETVDDWINQLSASNRIIRRATILVVDDEDMIIELFKESLKGKGYSIRSARNGLDALQLLNELEIDLVFLDLKLRGMDGAEIYRRLKDTKPYLPVVIMTGYPDSEVMAKALTQGPFALRSKPFTDKDILAAVNSFIRTGEQIQREELSNSKNKTEEPIK
jgi:excisionase family DNA binding protein